MTYNDIKDKAYDYLVNKINFTNITCFSTMPVSKVLISGLALWFSHDEDIEKLTEDELDFIMRAATRRKVYCIEYADTIIKLARELVRESHASTKYQYLLNIATLAYYDMLQSPEIQVVLELSTDTK